MLNNEFKLIGVVVEDYTEIGTEKFSKKSFSLEVDKKRGGPSTLKIIVYGTNSYIDTNTPILGKTVIVSGYIDSYKDFVSLIAQDMLIVGAETVDIVEQTLVSNDDMPF